MEIYEYLENGKTLSKKYLEKLKRFKSILKRTVELNYNLD